MRLRELSIIQYQNVTPTPEVHRLWLPLRAFERQLEHFETNPFRILSMDDAVSYMKRENELRKERPISLTFDNGFLDFYEHVFPLLFKRRFPGTLLISPDKVGKQLRIGAHKTQYLSWKQLEELGKGDIIIGAYEDESLNINDIPEEVVRRHISDYKKILEDRLGKEVRYFGVKEGVPNQKIRDHLRSEGYRAFLTECPTNVKPDLYSIGRIQVDDDDFNIFLTKISRTYLFFKDRKSWKYIREYSLDKVAHRISEAYDRLLGRKDH